MAIQNRRGYEADFDPAKMLPGEWAVSLDTKYVRMCFAPGECLRMATYEAFEQDMEEVKRILAECQDIQDAIEQIRNNISDTELVIENYVGEAKKYRDEAKQFRDEAEAFTPEGYSDLVQNVAYNTVKIDTVIEKAELNIKNTTTGENIHITDSADGKVIEFILYGKATQNEIPALDASVDINIAGSNGSIKIVTENEDSTKSTIATINTPYGLAGVIDLNNGFYVDTDGHHWRCDRIIKYTDGNGKRLQKVAKIVIDNNSNIGVTANENWFITPELPARASRGSVISNFYAPRNKVGNINGSCHTNSQGVIVFADSRFSTKEEVLSWLETHNVIVWYELQSVIETELTAEEIAEIEKMYTFYPVTNISNDADCGMEVKYLADAKNYIDNRLLSFESAIVNNI